MLLNELRAQRDVYTAMMGPGEKLLSYINRVLQLGQVLKTMEVSIDEKNGDGNFKRGVHSL